MKSRLAFVLILLLLALPVLSAWAAEGGEHAKEGGLAETIFKWVNFFIVFGGGAYFGAGALKKTFAEMRRGIQNQIAEARQQRESSQQRLKEIERRLAGLRD